MSNSNSSGGIGVPMTLFLIFLILKLTDVINWSWWWITAPLWGSILLFILALVFIAKMTKSESS